MLSDVFSSARFGSELPGFGSQLSGFGSELSSFRSELSGFGSELSGFSFGSEQSGLLQSSSELHNQM
jgi:phage-related protein